MNLQERFDKIKRDTIQVRNLWRGLSPRPDPFRCPILDSLIVEDNKIYGNTLINIFQKVCIENGYSIDNKFSAVAVSDEEFDRIFDLVEKQVKNV
jgi:hypothetical protein